MLLAVFTPSQDNTLFESGTGANSSGEGPSLFAGRTRTSTDQLRRAVLAFDLTSIPAGSVITEVTLELLVTRNPFESLVNHNFTLHPLQRNWGEGDSATTNDGGGLGVPASSGDATWLHAFFDSEMWTNAGGDFEATPSATASVGNEDAIASWSSAGLIADVQAWVDAPETNFGWLIRGDEGATGTARRFSSREGSAPPVLDVTFVEQTLPDVTLAVDNASVSEALGVATFTADLSAPANTAVTIDLGFSGTASAADYTASSGQIVIPAGSTSGSITVTAVQDTIDEPDELVVVDIIAVSGGTELGTQRQTTTILDDDDPPIPEVILSVDNTTIPESGGVAMFTAALSEATTVPVTVSFEFAGTASSSDYELSANSVVIPPGSTSGAITVAAVDDADDEPDETVVVTVTEVIGGVELGAQQTLTTIADDDEPVGLTVTSLTATSFGFVAEFSEELAVAGLNLYDTPNAGLGSPDVLFEGAATGPIAGSLSIDQSRRSVTFIKTAEPLAADSYTVTLRSGEKAFRDSTGQLLDGDGNGTSGDDHVSQFSVQAPAANAIAIGLPDFVRGPGQPINVPADSLSGIPLSISAASNVRAIDARISYDPDLIEISAATVGAAAPAGASVVLNNTTPGLAIVVFFSSDPLPAAGGEFVNLQASVPAGNASGIYRSSQVLDVHAVTISDGNDNEFPVVDDDGFHLVTYLGDTSANGRINASDAAQLAQFAALIGTGFAGLPNADPLVVGDVSGNQRLNALDASLVARFSALIEVPEIPEIPAGVLFAAGQTASAHFIPLEASSSLPAPRIDAHGAHLDAPQASSRVAPEFARQLQPIGHKAELTSRDLELAVDDLFRVWW